MTETTKYCTLDNYKNYRNNCEFCGEIDIEDFNTYVPNQQRIIKQIKALDFSKQLIEEKEYRGMTLEELKELKIVSNTDGRPTDDLTDEKWQKEFRIRKLFVKPHPSDVKKMKGLYTREVNFWNEETMGTYDGCTNWITYCKYINDVLDNIRSGQTDYCYFVYQILDLLKFHYDTLKTKYCDGYWEVWL